MNRFFKKWARHLVSRYVALIVYRKTVLQIVLSPNSHRNLKTAPSFWKTFLTYIHKNGVLWGCFAEWFTACLQIWFSKINYPLTFMKENGVLKPLFEAMFNCLFKMLSVNSPSLNSHRKEQKLRLHQKIFLPIWIFVGVLATFLSLVLKNIFLSSSNRTKRWQKSTLVKKIFLTYMHENGVLYTLFWDIFTERLQSLSPNSHRKTENQPFWVKKFAPHLYAKKWGFGKVFRRIIYSLFTEIVLANKKCTFRCMAKKSGRCQPRPLS